MALNPPKMSIKVCLNIYLALLLVHSLTGQVDHLYGTYRLCLHPTDEGIGFLADAS